MRSVGCENNPSAPLPKAADGQHTWAACGSGEDETVIPVMSRGNRLPAALRPTAVEAAAPTPKEAQNA